MQENERNATAMSTIYRKSGDRLFYNGNIVTRVTKKAWFTGIDVSKNPLIVSEALDDCSEATESEFNTAYKEAMDRITSGIV